jgi:3-oxoacyl-[acyl-carrier protein] reductase
MRDIPMMAASPGLGKRGCIVTGAAQGIGATEAALLARCDAAVLCVDRQDPAATVAAIRAAGGTAQGWHGDIGARDAPEAIVDAATQLGPPLTVVVNNAGIVRDRMAFNLTDADWDDVLAVNLTAPFRVCRAVIRHWRDQPRDDRRRIVNTSSESGIYGNAGQANYAAAKAGIAALTLTLAAEIARYDIAVNAIAPRARTPMSQAAFGDATDDALAPHHIATFVAWLASAEADGITGHVFVVAGREVQLLRGWTPAAHATQPDGWGAAESRELRERLFTDIEPRHVPGPIGDLFTAPQSSGEPRHVPPS